MSKTLNTIIVIFMVGLFMFAKIQSNYLIEVIINYGSILGLLMIIFFFPTKGNNQKVSTTLKVMSGLFLTWFLTKLPEVSFLKKSSIFRWEMNGKVLNFTSYSIILDELRR